MRIVTCGLLVVALGFLGTSAGSRADEEKVPLDKLPKAVAAAVTKRFPTAELVKASKEIENGKTLYEVALKDKGQKMDVTLTPEGQIQEIEKEITVQDLPKVVADAVDAKYPKATFKKVEEIIKVKDGQEKREAYEVLLVTTEKKTFEVVIAPGGKITKEEAKTEKEKDGK